MPDEKTLTEWFEIYRRDRMPDARPNTVIGWKHSVDRYRKILEREPVGSDLTAEKLKRLRYKMVAEGYSNSVALCTDRVLVALWRYLCDIGQQAEVAPKRGSDTRGRRILPRGRNKMEFDPFGIMVGLVSTKIEPAIVRDKVPESFSIDLPSISGPTTADFDQYRHEIGAVKEINRAELHRIFGTLVFNWSMLYQEWAGIDNKARNLWRFALLRFSESLGYPPELADLTAENLARVEKMLSDRSVSSAGMVVAQLRCVWRFAWEVGAMAEGPPIGGTWRQMRWSMQRFGRPSKEAS